MKTTIRATVTAGLLWGVMAGTAFAKDVLLAKVSNNNDALNGRLYVVTDEEDKAVGMKLHDLSDGSVKNFSVNQLGAAGVVLKDEKGGKYKVIVLRSNDFEVDRGGHFKLDMLYNGATGKRIYADMKLDFDGTTWKLFSRGTAISRIHFEVKKVAFLGVVGIKKVVFK